MKHPFDTAIEFDNLKGYTPVIRPLADGVRASTAAECPACAIIEYLNPTDERVANFFRPGVATLGHLLHQAWSWQSFGSWSDTHRVEEPIEWGAHGVTLGLAHDDTVLTEGKWCGQYEVKTHSEKESKAPSAANRRQTEFRWRLRERANLPVYGPYRIVTISKAGREGAIARGPWEVKLTDERRAEIDETVDRMARVLQRAKTLDLHFDPELEAMGCSRCFQKGEERPKYDVDVLISRATSAQIRMHKAEAMRAHYAAEKKHAKEQYDEARGLLDEHVPADRVLVGSQARVSKRRDGALQLKKNTAA